MAPVYVKGGAWTNVEDEILKAAVQKYGLNQWSRVASLLTKKSAKQAKARWNEWISPAINKTEWTKEEDEKLLSLVKLLSNQWRSIAPLMGRTATHCVERYQKLLEDQDDMEEDDDLRFAGAGIESMPAAGGKVGDLNINPESKPARPDEDTLEDEDREMLFEARARLANTKGKKAKRRDRERMLEETKRISLLQKRRELKAAGINVSLVSKNKKKSKEFDYNADIPFEAVPSAGLYDVTEEDANNQQASLGFNKKVSKEGLELEVRKEKKRKQAIENAEGKTKPTSSVEGQAKIIERPLKRTKFNIPGVESRSEGVDVEETELAGVFSTAKESQEDKDIDNRIKATLKGIQEAQARKSTLLRVSEDDTTAAGTATKLKPKQQRKHIIEVLKSGLSGLPTPKNEFEVLPQFEHQEDVILTKVADSQAERERLKNLQLLREVEDAKRELRRTQVIQRGLEVPNPVHLKTVDMASLSELDRAIVAEFHTLVKSDYKKYVDSTFDAAEVEEIDEDIYDEIQRQINEITSKTVEKDVQLETTLLPALDAGAKAQITQTVDSLKEEAQKVQNEVSVTFTDPTAVINSTKQSYNQLLEEQEKLQLYEEVADVEQKAIDYRTERLNDLVQPIVQKEQELNSYLVQLLHG